MKLMRNCREATALMVAREDRALPLGDRVALRLHLLICKACPRFAAQMRLMRTAMGAWRRYADSGDDGGAEGDPPASAGAPQASARR